MHGINIVRFNTNWNKSTIPNVQKFYPPKNYKCHKIVTFSTTILLLCNSDAVIMRLKGCFTTSNNEVILVDKEKQEKILVFLIDENRIDRQGLYSILSKQQDIEVIGQASSAEDVLQMADEILPKTVVLHYVPIEGNVRMVRRLREILSEVSVIVLADYENNDNLFQAIMAGASSFLTTQSASEQLVSIIRRVSKGEFPMSEIMLCRPQVAHRFLKRFHELSSMAIGLRPLFATLSPSENEVLTLIANGSKIEAITSSLNVNKQVIERYLTSALRKLDLNERTHITIMALVDRGHDSDILARDNTL